MKNWFLERFLPMWAKETVLKDNRRLLRQLQRLQQEKENLQSYIRGLHRGSRLRSNKEEV